MSTVRRQSFLVGVLFLVTHVTSVGAVILYGPMLTDDTWMTDGTSGSPQLLGAILDLMLALAVVGTAAGLVPLVRPHSERAAFGYLGLRTLEAGVILVGVVAVTGLVWFRADGGSGAAGDALLQMYRAAFQVGPGLVIGADTLVLAIALFRFGLVARWIPALAFVGVPLVVGSNLLVMFGVQEQVSPTTFFAAVPIFAWEISLAVYLLVKGVRAEAPVGG
jgi:hypothetical protein